MKKLYKYICMILLFIVIIFCLAGCGQVDNSAKNNYGVYLNQKNNSGEKEIVYVDRIVEVPTGEEVIKYKYLLKPEKEIVYVDKPVETIVEVEKEVIKEVEVPVEVPVEVIKYVTETKTKVVEKEVEVPSDCEFVDKNGTKYLIDKNTGNIIQVTASDEIQDKINEIKIAEKEIENEIKEENGTRIEGITYAEKENYYNLVTTPGTEFEYLAVYNCSDNTGGGCYNSYVLGCFKNLSKDKSAYSENMTYCHTGMLSGRGGWSYYLTYLNFSCFNYKDGEDYSKYIKDLTNRTSPGRYRDPDTGRESGWTKATYGIGVYVLKNARVQYFHNSTMCSYGGIPVGQTIITYEEAYYLPQLAELLLDSNNEN